MFDRLDTSKDGVIDCQEFMNWYGDVDTGEVEPEPMGYLDEETTEKQGKKQLKLFGLIKIKPRSPKKVPKPPSSKRIRPEEMLMVAPDELEFEAKALEAQVAKTGAAQKPFRVLDITSQPDPKRVATIKATQKVEKAAAKVAAKAAANAAKAKAGAKGGAGGEDDDNVFDDEMKSQGDEDDEGEGDEGEGEDECDGDQSEAGSAVPSNAGSEEDDEGGVDEDASLYDENGKVTLRSPMHFARHESEEEVIAAKEPPVAPVSQYRRAKSKGSRLENKPDPEGSKGKRKEKKGMSAIYVKTKLKAMKLLRKISGKYVEQWARRNIIAEARYKARVKARRRYRKDYPPIIACKSCPATFGLYRPYRRHFLFECPKSGDGELKPRMKRA